MFLDILWEARLFGAVSNTSPTGNNCHLVHALLDHTYKFSFRDFIYLEK